MSLRIAYSNSAPPNWVNDYFHTSNQYSANTHQLVRLSDGLITYSNSPNDNQSYRSTAVYIETPTANIVSNKISGDENSSGLVSLTVELSSKYVEDIVLPLIYTGSALIGSDFSDATTSIIIPAGSLSGLSLIHI